jgi:MFS family permease
VLRFIRGAVCLTIQHQLLSYYSQVPEQGSDDEMDAHMDAQGGALEAPSGASRGSARAALLALPLAQFVCSYAASNMNVAVSSIANDLGTDVHAVQIAISLFTLTMAALMIPGSKLTDIWGRKFCFLLGLGIYGVGALIATLAPGIGILIIGYSLFEGVGSALLIPPIYILVTVLFTDVTSRARSFGIVSAAAGIGAAAGPRDHRPPCRGYTASPGYRGSGALGGGPVLYSAWNTGVGRLWLVYLQTGLYHRQSGCDSQGGYLTGVALCRYWGSLTGLVLRASALP